jgi:signal transduction histidine kinase
MNDIGLNSLDGVFHDPEKERAFRKVELGHDAMRMTVFMVVAVVATIVFVKNDYLYFGLSDLFWKLMGLRAVYVVLSVLVLSLIWRKRILYPFIPWFVATLVVLTLIYWTRKTGTAPTAISHLVFIFVGYAVLPLRMRVKVLIGIIVMIVWTGYLFEYQTDFTAGEKNGLLVGLIATNVFGAFYAWHSGTRRRRLFSALNRETELKAEMQAWAAELEEANRALDSFARGVAHDLRNPLAGVVGLVELIKAALEEKNPNLKQLSTHLNSISACAQQMEIILESLLLLARIRRSDEVTLLPVDMNRVMIRVQERLSGELAASKARLSTSDTLPEVLGFEPWVDEVVANYMSNAIKYGGSPPDICIDAERLDDGHVRISFKDNGAGVPEEKKTEIFEEFVRVEHTKVDGLGLGLSIVKKIVNRLGGRVGVDNPEDGGSLFWFTLPEAIGAETRVTGNNDIQC